MTYRPDPDPEGHARVPLAGLLRATAHHLNAQAPTPERLAAAQVAMQAAFKQARPPVLAPVRRRRFWGGALAWSGAATCAVVLVAATALLTMAPPYALDGTRQASGGSDFVPLVSPERWSAYLDGTGADARTGTAWVVATEMTGDRMAALGLPFDPSRAGDSVRAELLMHASGDVLAVRLLR